MPQGVHVLLVRNTPGGELLSTGPSEIQTNLNSVLNGYGGAESRKNSIKLNLIGENPADFDISIYSHEITHAILESSPLIGNNFPLLRRLNEHSNDFAEFFCDFSAFLSTGQVFQLSRFYFANDLRGLSQPPYAYDIANQHKVLVSSSSAELLKNAKQLNLNNEMITNLKQLSSTSLVDPHLTGVSFARILSKIPRSEMLLTLRESFKGGESAADWLENISKTLPQPLTIEFEKEIRRYNALNWILYIDSKDVETLF